MRAEKPGSNGDFYVYLRDANDRKIVGVWGKRGEKEATAALIAAAPDLHYVAVLVTELAPILGENNAVVNLARAALSKARGEQ